MLHQFITDHRDAIIDKSREKVSALSETLRLETTATPFPTAASDASVADRGADLLTLGFTVGQVIGDYGEICQAITAVAGQYDATVTAGELLVLHHCLDTAIAGALTEHARLLAERRALDLSRQVKTAGS
jgi:hypothetical protein